MFQKLEDVERRYVDLETSLVDPAVIGNRKMIAVGIRAVTVAGSTRWRRRSVNSWSPVMSYMPVAGNTRSFSAKTNMSIRAIQNDGIDAPTTAADMNPRSNRVCAGAPARSPRPGGGQDQRVGALLEERGQPRDVHLDRAAHVAAQRLAEPADVLHVHGPIQTERLAELGHRLRGGRRSEDGHGRVAWDDLQQEEGDQGHADEDGNDGEKSLGEVRGGDRRPLRVWAAPPRCDDR